MRITLYIYLIKISFSILCIVGLLTACDEGRSGIQGDGNANNKIFIGENLTVNTVEKEKELPRVDITGNWDEKRARRIMISTLTDEVFLQDFDCKGENCLHKVIDFYAVELTNKVQMIGVTSSRAIDHDCHPCGVQLSLFEFAQYENGWLLEQIRPAVIEWGSYGEVAARELAFFPIGPNKYCFNLEGGYTSQGYTVVHNRLYTYLGGKLELVLDIETYSDNKMAHPEEEFEDPLSGVHREQWQSKIKAIKTGEIGLYDLEVHVTGLKKGTYIDETTLYKFNGKEYISNTGFQ